MTGRGCSTKDKVFYKECETHSYGEQVEKMCFCSYFLCNLSTKLAAPPSFILLIIGATLCVLSNYDSYDYYDNCQKVLEDHTTKKHPPEEVIRDKDNSRGQRTVFEDNEDLHFCDKNQLTCCMSLSTRTTTTSMPNQSSIEEVVS